MKSLTLKIKNGVPETIGISGDYVRVKTASVPVRIQVESGDVDATIEQGDALNLKPFTRLVISHADAAEQTITLLIGDGTSADSAKVGGSVAVTGTVAVDDGGTFASSMAPATIGLVAAAISPANAARRFLLIQNIDAAGVIWIRFNANPAIDGGIRLEPGAMLLLEKRAPAGNVQLISNIAACKYVFAEA